MSDAFTKTGGLPSIIGEFSFRAADANLPNEFGGGGVPVALTQTARADQYLFHYYIYYHNHFYYCFVVIIV